MNTVRSLEALTGSASTSRVLNLHSVAKRFGAEPDYAARPFFQDPVLNRAIVVKHRLRLDERYRFPAGRSVVTKVIFPFDGSDLAIGGQSVIVNEPGYRESLADAVRVSERQLTPDFERLALLDSLPSLDPFLVREQFRRNDLVAADVYFDISEADARRMLGFVSAEILDLIRLAFSGGGSGNNELVDRLADALLSTKADTRLEPLRLTLGLEGDQFREGVFSWKGFLYYKWQFAEAAGSLARVSSQIDKVRLIGRASFAEKQRIMELQNSLRTRIATTARGCAQVLALYDEAFRDLVDRGYAAAFRRFLLDAPLLFIELGHRMGVVSHIASYWQFRFKPGRPLEAKPDEFIDLLQEFELSLASDGQSGGALAIKQNRERMAQLYGMVA